MESLILVCVIVVLLFSLLVLILSRYKKCPSDKVMVIYGKVGSNKDGSARSARCIHGGAAFVWPVFQSYEFLDLTPLSISVDLENALSRQNIRINVPSRFTVGISTEPGVMQNAAERMLGLKLAEIQELAKDIILGQLRLVIATMDIEEINSDRDKFLEAVSRNVEGELKKIGLPGGLHGFQLPVHQAHRLVVAEQVQLFFVVKVVKQKPLGNAACAAMSSVEACR